jgi:hypothetical protein
MKKIMQKITDTLADAALLEMGVEASYPVGNRVKIFRESLEDHLVEIAFAEAADYDQIHEAILREHFKADDQVHDDDCQYGDNDACFAH